MKRTTLARPSPHVHPQDSHLAVGGTLHSRMMEDFAGYLSHADDVIGRSADLPESIGEIGELCRGGRARDRAAPR